VKTIFVERKIWQRKVAMHRTKTAVHFIL
jgi:hypothetical protein